ncbi:nucleoside diphosphate-linked moiety X motif 17-like [Periplaneta americana]|uniref:nucleoside diphosphate-linked moiety X motif 17-like n=1 Tax=Periplaneta americana TaxID=6978 RepID=UPI0037E88D8C
MSTEMRPSLQRMVVGLKSHGSLDKPKIADFLICLVHHFSPNAKSTIINCDVEDDMLVLSSPNDDNVASTSKTPSDSEFQSVTLHHSPICPFWKLHERGIPVTPPKNRDIYVGVAVLLESSDSHILMTQRSERMRSFPKAWVPPGGHLEVGEPLVSGALRELREEAGLMLDSSNSNTRLFCLWESVYPPLFEIGEPKNHHVVLYFHAKSSETWEQLQAKINLDPTEVRACTWLTKENVESIRRGNRDDVEIVQQFVVGEDGNIHPEDLNIHRMFYSDFWNGDAYTGSQLVLMHWLNGCNGPSTENISSRM